MNVEAAMTAKTSFGQWLKHRRKTLDLTQEDLAQRIGCAVITIYKLEADKRRPSKQIAELLAEYLNIPPAERAAFVQFARAKAAESFAPWGTPFHPPTNLPTQPTNLIGRDEDVATTRKRLLQPESRLLTLTGPPGIGKTRLALQVAAQTLDDFADGVFFIALAPITDANLVPTTIANTLGVPDVGPRTPLERLKAFLRDRQTLLILDNFEQILGAAPHIAELLAACPWLKILVTSRAPLHVRPERQFPVLPLTVPNLDQVHDVATVTGYSAVTLFLERAQAVQPDFSLTQENVQAVAAICTRLDGLPLAIELISARVKLLPPAALLERLHGRLMLQSDGLRDLEPRHRTLNAAIEWSYQLLSADEQMLFRRLGKFMGGWTLEAAESVCMGNLKLNLLDGLASLLDKNLVKRDTRVDSDPRFIMLETIREYALEQLTASGELEVLQRQHARYFVTLAEAATPIPQQGLWWDRLELEHPNFRAALGWGETELRLAVALAVFWARRGHLNEGKGWLTGALARSAEGTSTETYRTLRARALEWLGDFGIFQGEQDAPQPRYEESLALYGELGNTDGIAEVLSHFAMLFVMRGDHERAVALLEESLELYRELGNKSGVAWVLFFMGQPIYIQGHIQRAGAMFEESVALFRAVDDTWGIASALFRVAMVALDEGAYRQAGAYLVESMTRLRELGERWQIVNTLEVFACLAAIQRQQLEDSQPNLLMAARIFGATEVLRETLSAPVLPSEQHFYERGVATLRAQLDPAALAAAWAEGRAMSLEQAVAYALKA
jgi:predicted ATPase/DNA-binding XRE family transcriptional regulator